MVSTTPETTQPTEIPLQVDLKSRDLAQPKKETIALRTIQAN